MALEKWSERIVVVHLAEDPQLTEDFEAIDDLPPRFDVVLDFDAVQYVNSSNIARLLSLRKRLITADRRLMLCNVKDQVWGAFLVTGLDQVFELSDNVTTALATLQMAPDSNR